MTRIVQREILGQRRRTFALTALFACGLATIARAEVHVEGSPAAVRVTTGHDAISDVLSAFAVAFNVQYRTAIPLDATAKATYSGSFGQVLSRLLDGYNYVIKTEQETIEIVVFGRHGEIAIPGPAPEAPTDKSILSRWR